MKNLFATCFLGYVSATAAFAGGCSDMAAFNTEVDKFMTIASVDKALLEELEALSIDCKDMHQSGSAIADIKACDKALSLIKNN